MSVKTTNYNLIKPDKTDFYDIGNQNTNMDIIDTELKNINDTKATKTAMSAANEKITALETNKADKTAIPTDKDFVSRSHVEANDVDIVTFAIEKLPINSFTVVRNTNGTNIPEGYTASDNDFIHYVSKISNNWIQFLSIDIRTNKTFRKTIRNGVQEEWTDSATTKTMTTTISTTFSGSVAPYIQTISLENIKSTDNPMISPIYDSNVSTAILQKKAWSCIDEIETDNGSIIVKCFKKKPTTNIPIQIKVVR